MKPLPSNPLGHAEGLQRLLSGLWNDKLGQISLAVTTLFWGAGATLQFIVIAWADAALGYNLQPGIASCRAWSPPASPPAR